MTIYQRRELRDAADEILANTPNQRKIVFFWAWASSALALLVSSISYLLSDSIAGTGGLDGMGLRSILTTAQSLLGMFSSVALPFWVMGYTHAMLRLSRKQQANNFSLLEGFRRFGPGLRLMLLQGLLFGSLLMACLYFGITLLSMTPLATPVLAVLDPILQELGTNPEPGLTEEAMAAITDAMTPMIIGCLVIYGIVLIPLSYRLRFAQMRLMDDPPCGALAAIRESTTITRRHCIALFRLDLSFWWFYALELGILLLAYSDILLVFLGIPLPVNSEGAFWLSYVFSMIAQVAIYTLFHNKVTVTYALAYDALRKPPSSLPVTDPGL